MRPNASPRPVVLFLFLAAILSLLGPILLFSSATALFIDAWAVQASSVLIAGLALAAVLTAETLQPMQLSFWTFSYVWLAIAPLAMLTRDTYPWGLRVSPGVSFTASCMVLLGLLAYLAASLLCRFYEAGRNGVVVVEESDPALNPEQHAVPPPVVRGWVSSIVHRFADRRLTWNRAVGATIASVLLAGLLVPRSGGVGSFFQSREAANDATAAATGASGGAGAALLNWGLSVPAFWALVALLHLPPPARTFNARLARRMLVGVAVVVNLVVNNPISQPRFWAGTVLLSLLFTSRFMTSPKAFRVGGILLLVSLVLLFPIADYFRYEKHQHLDAAGITTQLTTNPDYDAYQQIQAGVLLVEAMGNQPKAMLGPPLFWVPRSVWPSKPEDMGIVIARFVGYTFLNLSSPLWVETYVWGGLFGTVAIFAALGFLSRRADIAFHRHRFDRSHLANVIVAPLAFYQFIILRGSLLQAMAALSLLLVIPVLITVPEAKRRTSHRSMPDTRIMTGMRSAVDVQPPRRRTSRPQHAHSSKGVRHP
jgi:hypothetical protein